MCVLGSAGVSSGLAKVSRTPLFTLLPIYGVYAVTKGSLSVYDNANWKKKNVCGTDCMPLHQEMRMLMGTCM